MIGPWIAAFLTLAILSYLYKDNPFYKVAEHLFVGISTGYCTSMFFWTQIKPNLFGRLWPATEYNSDLLWYKFYNLLGVFSSIFPDGGINKGHHMELLYLLPFALGIMMLLSVSSKLSWMARWGIAYTVGMAAGLRAYGFLNSNVLGQIRGSAFQIFNSDLPFFALVGESTFNNFIILIGTITGLMYFYFSREHTGTFGRLSKLGIYFLMISFGASFGFAVMGRISLLIGRFVDLITYSGSAYNHATLWLLLAMILLLGYSAFTDKNNASQDEPTIEK